MYATEPLMEMLIAALDVRGVISIRLGRTITGSIAEVDYRQKLITISCKASSQEARCALAAMFVHLEQGPPPRDDEINAELTVHRQVARRLVARAMLPVVLDGIDPAEVAKRANVDVPTAELAIAAAREIA